MTLIHHATIKKRDQVFYGRQKLVPDIEDANSDEENNDVDYLQEDDIRSTIQDLRMMKIEERCKVGGDSSGSGGIGVLRDHHLSIRCN